LTDSLQDAVGRLVNRVLHWTPNRWAKPFADDSPETRAARVHVLAQRLADAAADAEGQPHRRVPRLDNDLAIPDQLRVLVADAAAAGVQDQDLIELVRETAAGL
jgi:hypothetical protein